jgi:hypothetical protein
MDIRDILKSFDQLTEGEKTVSDKGTVHKASPGGYGNKHGSEDVKDQYGQRIGKASLAKMGKDDAPAAVKRGKGRPPKNADSSGEVKKYDSSELSKAMGMGKAPKATGKPSVKHSLKEYFDIMDEAKLNELSTGLVNKVHDARQQNAQQAHADDYADFSARAAAKSAETGVSPMQVRISGDRPAAHAATAASKKLDRNKQLTINKPNSNYANDQAGQAAWAQKVGQTQGSGMMREAGLAVQPMPATPQQKQQQAVATKPSFMIKDPANPNMPAITTQDPAVVQAAKNGTMSMQKPGAAPTGQPAPGAAPAAGAGSQVAPMKETGDNWIKDATKNKGAFTAKAKSHGMTPAQFRAKVLAHKEDYPAKTEKQAQLAKTLSKMHEGDAPQHFAQSSPLSTANRGVLESKKTVKKDDRAEKDGKKVTKDIEYDDKKKKIKEAAKPDFLDMDKDGDKKEPMKKAVKDKKKVKEGMEHHLQAARLEGKSHALRKMPYNCTHDDMEEARCYHDGFKEGLDECYGQMPIMGRTAVDENPVTNKMASYGADDMGMDEGNAFTAGLAKTPHGSKFKVGGNTFTDRTRYDSNLDEFAFESLDKQLNSLLESEEKVSEGMTVSISKGQQGSPDSVSVSAQDGEADQLLSIIKSAGMGLFGGDEHNGYGAPQGSTQAPGGIEVVDDHDGMMALMKKLTGGGDMQGGGDYEDEEGHEGHSEEGHMHGEEEPCNECGYMESKCQCDHGDEQVVDEVESRDQMAYNVAEDNPPDNGSANSTNDTQGNDAANQALATADADEDEAVDESEEEDEKDDEKDFFHNPRVPADKQLKAPPKEVNVAESFANLYKKLALLSEESTEKEDEKAEEAGKKVKKDIEYDDKKDKKEKKLDEWANEAGKNGTDAAFETDIDYMTNVISGGLNKQKSTGQTTIPVVAGQKSRMGVDGLGSPMKESTDLLRDYKKLSGL